MNSTSLPVQSPAPLPASTSIPSATLGVARTHFEQLRGRARRGIWIETLGLLGLLLVAFAVPSFLTDRGLRLEWAFRFVLLASFVVVLGRIVLRRLVRPLTVRLDDEEMALAVERHRLVMVAHGLVERAAEDRRAQGGHGANAVADILFGLHDLL